MNLEKNILERTPPQAVDVEQAVLGAMLMSKEAIGTAIEILGDGGSAFYGDRHRAIYRAAITLYNSDIPVDLITLSEQLEKDSALDYIGGRSYLVTLTELTASAANIEHHCNIVLGKATRNEIISASSVSINDAYDETKDVDAVLDESEQRIFNIKERSVKRRMVPLADVLEKSFEAVVTKQHVTGLPTGFRELDRMTRGLQNSDFIVIGGRPSMGKTAFMLNISDYLATKDEPVPVGIFSLEMSSERIGERLLLSRAGLSAWDARDDRYSGKVTKALGELTDAPIFIDDSPAPTPLEIKAKARRLKSKEDIGLLVVDYIQLVAVPHIKERHLQVAYVGRSLKILAKELDIPVIGISQLNRECEYRPDKRPVLADFRESGDLEQDTDLGILLFRPARYPGLRIVPIGQKEKQVPLEEYTELIIAKQRNGPTGSREMVFMKEQAKFFDVSKREEV